MNRRRILFAILVVIILCSCGTDRDRGKEVINNETITSTELLSEEMEAISGEEFSWDNTTIFRYGETEYDLREVDQSINAIMWCEKVGKYVVIDGHVGPYHDNYCIFNTEIKEFEKRIAGANFTWHSDDINTSVYSFWHEIYNFDGEVIATCNLKERDFIYSIEFIENNTQIEVEICPAYGDNYTVVFPLPKE